MALEISELETFHKFTFAKHLVFENKTTYEEIKNKANPNEKEIFLGRKFAQELKEGFVPLCEVKYISEDIGYGLYAVSSISKGSYVGEYTGLICSGTNYYKMKNYLFRYPVKNNAGNEYSIDAEPYGNHTRFINHSFSPNLDHSYALHDGLFHLILIANQNILPGHQFSFNYGHSYWYLRGAPENL